MHVACFNNDVPTLKLLIDEIKRDPNSYVQYQLDNSPLKYAYKNDLLKTIELLCSRGAYYQYENLTNNMIKDGGTNSNPIAENKYKTMDRVEI
jgi:hypothetical protein